MKWPLPTTPVCKPCNRSPSKRRLQYNPRLISFPRVLSRYHAHSTHSSVALDTWVWTVCAWLCGLTLNFQGTMPKCLLMPHPVPGTRESPYLPDCFRFLEFCYSSGSWFLPQSVWLEGCSISAPLEACAGGSSFIRPWQAHSFLLRQLNVGSPGVVLASFLLLWQSTPTKSPLGEKRVYFVQQYFTMGQFLWQEFETAI